MVSECLEFFRGIWKKFRVKKRGFGKKSQPHFETVFFKNQFFFHFSLNIFSLTCRMALIFFNYSKEQSQADLLNTLIMVIECMKNFLEEFEKRFEWKMGGWQEVATPFWDQFFLIGFLALFLEYIFFDVSYGFDFLLS